MQRAPCKRNTASRSLAVNVGLVLGENSRDSEKRKFEYKKVERVFFVGAPPPHPRKGDIMFNCSRFALGSLGASIFECEAREVGHYITFVFGGVWGQSPHEKDDTQFKKVRL